MHIRNQHVGRLLRGRASLGAVELLTEAGHLALRSGNTKSEFKLCLSSVYPAVLAHMLLRMRTLADMRETSGLAVMQKCVRSASRATGSRCYAAVSLAYLQLGLGLAQRPLNLLLQQLCCFCPLHDHGGVSITH